MDKMIDATVEAGRYNVMLPCEPEQFKEFITGLLGKPQTLTQGFHGTFDITGRDVENLYHLVSQRVQQQNHGTLIQFSVRIVFDDGSSVLLNTLDDFLSYIEIRPVISTQVHLSWVFLIQFPDRAVPEKQTIDVSFLTSLRVKEGYADVDETILRSSLSVKNGCITVRIEHTARTWGADIQGLLDNHLQNLLAHEPPVRALVRRNSGKISFFIGALVYAFILVAIFLTGSALLDSQNSLVGKFQGASVNLSSKMDFLIGNISTGLWERYLIASLTYVVVGFFVSIAIGTWTASTADSRKPSFILLTQASEKSKKSVLENYESRWISFIWSIVFAVLTGILGNIAYAKYWAQ